jgi:hypothetical protein
MAQTAKETAEVLINKFGKEQALEKAEGGVKAAQHVIDQLKYEDPLFTSQVKYWREVTEEINSK